MKVAFHFDTGSKRFGNPYGTKIEAIVFRAILQRPSLRLSSKIYIGDLPFLVLCPDEQTQERCATMWCEHVPKVWNRFVECEEDVFQTDVFLVCCDSLTKQQAEELHKRLSGLDGYKGALEIDDTFQLHWDLYSDALRLTCRVEATDMTVLTHAMGDELSEDEKEERFKALTTIGFSSIRFESDEGKHSLFDRYHNFEHARRVSEWRTGFGDLLAFVADNVVTKLGDAAPKLGDKLWAAYNTFNQSETEEQLAQVCVSCRRTIEYVADTLFPPKETQLGERKLGAQQYRNRLLAFAEDSLKSGTNIEVICSSLDLLAKHIEALEGLANQGIHAEVMREGARRCLLRTVFLLDDIVSLRPRQFKMCPDLDFSILRSQE